MCTRKEYTMNFEIKMKIKKEIFNLAEKKIILPLFFLYVCTRGWPIYSCCCIFKFWVAQTLRITLTHRHTVHRKNTHKHEVYTNNISFELKFEIDIHIYIYIGTKGTAQLNAKAFVNT